MNKSLDGMMIYCVRDKKKLPAHNVSIVRTTNNRARVIGLCPNNHRVSQFVSGKVGQGLLGNLLGMPGGQIPGLSSLPLIGALF